MVPQHVLALGVDAIVTYLSGLMYSSAFIREKISNSLSTMKFTNLRIFRVDK